MKFPETMLAVMVSERWSSCSHSEPFFIDRDASRFRYVLDFYRDGEIILAPGVSREEMVREAEYFGLPISDESVRYDMTAVAHLCQQLDAHEMGIAANSKVVAADIKKEAAKLHAIACAHQLVGQAIEKLAKKSQYHYVDLKKEEVATEWAKQSCPTILGNEHFKEAAAEIARVNNYKFAQPISTASFELGYF